MTNNSELRAAYQKLDSLQPGSPERHNAVKAILDKALALDGYSRTERRRLLAQAKAELSEQAEQEAESLRDEVRSYLSH